MRWRGLCWFDRIEKVSGRIGCEYMFTNRRFLFPSIYQSGYRYSPSVHARGWCSCQVSSQNTHFGIYFFSFSPQKMTCARWADFQGRLRRCYKTLRTNQAMRKSSIWCHSTPLWRTTRLEWISSWMHYARLEISMNHSRWVWIVMMNQSKGYWWIRSLINTWHCRKRIYKSTSPLMNCIIPTHYWCNIWTCS